MAGGAGSAAKIALAERRHMALSLRKQGGSYRDIAETLRGQEGVSPKYDQSQAMRDVLFELRRLNDSNGELAEELRRLEAERLDELQVIYWDKAKAGDTFATDHVLAIMDRRARYFGLYMPTKFAGAEGGPIVITVKGDGDHL